jgi:hypothetical protein
MTQEELQMTDVEDGSVIEIDALKVSDVHEWTPDLRPFPRGRSGALSFGKTTVPPGMSLRKSIQTSITIDIEGLVIAQPEDFLIDSITAGGHEILGFVTHADLFSPLSIGVRLVDVSLRTNEHMIITVRNVGIVPRVFVAAAMYKVA